MKLIESEDELALPLQAPACARSNQARSDQASEVARASILAMPRDLQPELMDAPDLDRVVHAQALAGLARLNRVSGVARLMYRQVLQHAKRLGLSSMSVLDVASGAGDVPISWLKRAARDNLRIQLTTLDRSSYAIEEQQRRAHRAKVTIRVVQQDCLASRLPTGFDLVTNSLFMHHLDEHHVVALLRSMALSTNSGMIVCDLERSRFNFTLVGLAAQVLSRSMIVHHDSVASVRGSFTRHEFQNLSKFALDRRVHVKSAFPCRFILSLSDLVCGDYRDAGG